MVIQIKGHVKSPLEIGLEPGQKHPNMFAKVWQNIANVAEMKYGM